MKLGRRLAFLAIADAAYLPWREYKRCFFADKQIDVDSRSKEVCIGYDISIRFCN